MEAMAWRMALHLFGELDHRGLQRDAVNWGLRIACEAEFPWSRWSLERLKGWKEGDSSVENCGEFHFECAFWGDRSKTK